MENFYCKNISLDDFSIYEWDKKHSELIAAGVDMSKAQPSLCEVKCDYQCLTCKDFIIDRKIDQAGF